jgi:hypothetical protein
MRAKSKDREPKLIAMSPREIEDLIARVVRATIAALEHARALPTDPGHKESLVSDGCITAEEAGELLGYSRNAIIDLLDQKRIPYTEVIIDPTAAMPKRMRRIPRKAVLDFAAKHLVLEDEGRA